MYLPLSALMIVQRVNRLKPPICNQSVRQAAAMPMNMLLLHAAPLPSRLVFICLVACIYYCN